LLRQLLDKNVRKRINPDKIPSHPFFKKLNFNDVAEMKIEPPFKPKVRGIDDLSNIDPAFLREDVYSPVKKQRPVNIVEQSKFKIIFRIFFRVLINMRLSLKCIKIMKTYSYYDCMY
jgi:hypothetical protein